MSLVQSLPVQTFPHTRCPQCGSSDAHTESTEESQRRIRELETQVRLLNTKAAAAADKLADYEDELQLLRVRVQETPRPGTNASPSEVAAHKLERGRGHTPPPPGQPSPPLAQNPSRLSSLSSLLPGRRTPAILSPQPPPPDLLPPHPNTSTHSLPSVLVPNGHLPNQPTTTTTTTGPADHASTAAWTDLLQAETKARLEAESSLSQAHSELEELTAQLFGQANEMVATERKARAKLEERVAVLEKRDGERRKRLENLEIALKRIERVRGLVG